MTIDQFIQKCDTLLSVLEKEAPAISDEIALNAIALIKNRIIDKEGIRGKSYSQRPMLATQDQFIVKSAFKQTKVPKKRGGTKGLWIKFPTASKAVPVMELPGGYKQFREIQGRQGARVDLSLTGKMWQGVTITQRIQKGLTFVTVIGGSNREAQSKLEWMTGKYGPFLVLMPEEKGKLNELMNKRLQPIVDKFLK